MAEGSGYGKTIIIGDQFVRQGVSAIVSALPYKTVCTVERTNGEGWTLEDNRMEVPGYKANKLKYQGDSINRVLEGMNIDVHKNPIKITFGGDLLAGSGIGASGASCIALANALNNEFEQNLPIDKINYMGWLGEFAYHGNPSGVDNTASCYGGMMRYWMEGEEKNFQKITPKKPLKIVLANSGVTADTSALGGLLAGEKKKDPSLFATRVSTIYQQSTAIEQALQEGDLGTIGTIMTENHKILIEMGLSHEKLVYLCDKAIDLGAYGAKLTGGGMGGYMIALAPDQDVQQNIATTFKQEGYSVITAEI